MLILGIETSCDETSCAVVKDGRTVLSNVIASQIALHRKTGGVVPEVAAREHVAKIRPVLEMALKKAGVTLGKIDAIAVTAGPGLLSSLLIGVNAAMTLALVLKKPLIPVNHIEGHVYANWLEQNVAERSEAEGRRVRRTWNYPPKFPIAVLTVSGGHNELLIWNGHGRYQFLGATLDDAAGEAFDKVARLLGLPYPGGPEIQKAATVGNPQKYVLPRAWLMGKHSKSSFDFSFSGLKTAVLRLVQEHSKKSAPGYTKSPSSNRLKAEFIADVASSFQESVCEVLATKLVEAAKKYRVEEVHLAGGVSANQELRRWTATLMRKHLSPAVRLRFCTDLTLCTDNAAMIATAGYYAFKKNPARYPAYRQAGKKWRPIIANPNLEIKQW